MSGTELQLSIYVISCEAPGDASFVRLTIKLYLFCSVCVYS